MIKIGLAFLIFILSTLYSSAQPLSIQLKLSPNEKNYPLMIEAEPQDIYQYVKENTNCRIGSQIDRFFTLYTDIKGLRELYHQKWIKRIEDGKIEIRPMMDSSRILNNIDSVHNGLSPLVSDYKGRNVLVGIIDMGIEWRHLDFKKSPNDTRILSIWDQNKDSIAPIGYTYGHLWTKLDIDSGKCRHNASSSFGHGTNVAGIAVGNGNIRSQNCGIAPEAKILVVSLKNDNAWLSNIIDGIHYIFNQADILGLPCIINISVGTYDGSHDGKDISTRMIEATLNRKGRVIVAAGGNAGHINQHIRFQPYNDTLFTDFLYTPSYSGCYFNFWADTQDVRNLTIGIQADSPTSLLPLSLPYYFPFKTRFLDSLIKYGYYEDSMEIKNSLDSSMGNLFFYVLKQENTVNFQCYIKPKKTNHLWRFSTTGKGMIDMWVNNSIQQSSNIFTTPLPSSVINPSIGQYKLSDQSMSITSSFQCSDKIITVGNYVNKYGIIDIDTIYRPIGGKQNEIASNSSKGPTRDGRQKPDICASGGQTMTTIDSVTSAAFSISTSNRKKLGISGKYLVAGGTSMSSPVVAGSLALLFEKNPNLDYTQTLYLIKKTAKKDSFTTPYPNNTYGNGKINTFQLLSYIPVFGCRDTGSINFNPSSDFEDSSLCIKKVYGCTDTGSINFNPNANIDNGSCIKKIYGCTDTGSINYNPLANVDNGSCVKKVYGCTDSLAINFNPLANVADGSCIYKHSSIQYRNESKVEIYPNPTKEILHIHFTLAIKPLNVELISSMGVVLIKKEIETDTSLDISKLPTGIYTLILSNEQFLQKIKVFVE